MGWINTAEKSLVNSDAIREIKFFDLTNEKEKLSLTEIVAVFFDGERIVLGYADGPVAAEELIATAISRQFFKFSYSFRDVCEIHSQKIKDLSKEKEESYEKDKSKYTEYFNKYWEKSEEEINRIRKSCSREEIEIDCYL